MHLSALLLLAGTTAASASAFAQRSPYLLKETHNVPPRWKEVGAPASDHVIYLQIGLRQSNFEKLEEHLYEGIFPWMASCAARDLYSHNCSL